MTYDELVTAVTDYTENNVPTVDMNTFIRQAEQRIYNTVQFPSLRKNVTGVTTQNSKYLSCPTDFLSVYSMAVIDASGNYEYLLNKDVNFIRQAYPNPNTDKAIPRYYALFGPTTSGTNPVTLTNELSFILGPTPDAEYSVELHYFFYPQSIVKAGVVVGRLDFNTAVYNYVVGTYEGIAATGGSGSGLTVDIVITNALGYPAIASITANNGGQNYVAGDTVQVDLALLTGGVDQGSLSLTVLTVEQDLTNTTWLSENFDTVLLYGTLVEAYTYMKGEADMMALYDGKYKEALALAKRLGDGLERGDAYRDGQFKQKVM